MAYKTYLVFINIGLLATPMSMAEELAKKTDAFVEKKPLYKIIVTSNPIFDESDPDSFFIHHWANYLHINTRESTILNRLSFSEGSMVSQKDIDEAQRNLRNEPYIRDAKISFTERAPDADAPDEGEVVLVETWDNWSLLPTVSLSRSGGDSQFSIGFKENNLLGYGIRTNIEYQSSDDRSGYQFAVQAPLDSLIKHSTLDASFQNNSDGQAIQFQFDKPFNTLDVTNMYGMSYLDTLMIDTIRQNGMDINEFEHKQDFINLQYGWRINQTANSRSRILTGITQDKSEFTNLDTHSDTRLPQDRDFLYPWMAYEYLQDNYKILNNIKLINTNEDFNLGWYHYFELGLETQDLDNSLVGYHLNWATTRGYQKKNKLLLFTLDGTGTFATSQKDFYQINTMAEYFHQFTPKWTAYAKTRLSTSNNNYLDNTFALGDNTDIRGYPNDYQHGDNQWLFTAELRNYPNINLYQLAELGWVAFVDVGQATGGPDGDNEVSGPIGSVGVGARIYSSRSSYGNVAHIDISMPFTTGVEINKWELRFQVRNRF